MSTSVGCGNRSILVSAIFTFVLVAEVKSHGWLTLPRGYPVLPRFSGPQSFPAQRQSPTIELVPGTLDQLNHLEPHWVCTNSKSGEMMIIGTENGNLGGTTNAGYPQQNPQYPSGAGGVSIPGGQNVGGQWPQQPQYYPQQSVPQLPQQQQQQQQPGPQYNPQQPMPQNPQQQGPQYNPQQPMPQNPQQQGPQYNPQQPMPQNPQQQKPFPQNPSQTTQPQQPQNPGFVEVPWTVLPGNTPGPSSIPTPTTTTEDPYKRFENFDWSQYVNDDPSKMQTIYNGDGIIEPRML